jgi:hypothetical protein
LFKTWTRPFDECLNVVIQLEWVRLWSLRLTRARVLISLLWLKNVQFVGVSDENCCWILIALMEGFESGIRLLHAPATD